jgi:CTP synthase (UTP-ammonia lyase)
VKAYNATLNDESSEEETSAQDQFLAFVAPYEDQEDSQSSYFEHSKKDGEELKEASKILYIEFEKLRETRKQHIHKLNSLQIE